MGHHLVGTMLDLRVLLRPCQGIVQVSTDHTRAQSVISNAPYLANVDKLGRYSRVYYCGFMKKYIRFDMFDVFNYKPTFKWRHHIVYKHVSIMQRQSFSRTEPSHYIG